MDDAKQDEKSEEKMVLFTAHFTEDEAKEFDEMAARNHRTRKRHLEFLVRNWLINRRGKSDDFTY